VPSRVGVCARNHDLVSFAGTDVVVTARASVELHGLIGLHVAYVDRVRFVVGPSGSGPGMVGHRGSGSAGEESPGDEQRDHQERARDEEEVAPAPHLISEGVQAHGDTVPKWRR